MHVSGKLGSMDFASLGQSGRIWIAIIIVLLDNRQLGATSNYGIGSTVTHICMQTRALAASGRTCSTGGGLGSCWGPLISFPAGGWGATGATSRRRVIRSHRADVDNPAYSGDAVHQGPCPRARQMLYISSSCPLCFPVPTTEKKGFRKGLQTRWLRSALIPRPPWPASGDRLSTNPGGL